jgi:predicted MFS family arabinose efflux permease
VLTLLGVIGPWWLLALTFALGLGSAMNQPAWSATIPELVPREELAHAVALNSVGFNIARSVGPALGGAVMAASGAGVVFLLNALSFLGVIVVLSRWHYTRPAIDGPEPRLHHAMREGVRYVRATPAYHAVLIRTGLFSFAGSALWGLLPVVASSGLAKSSTGYGILLGCLGVGSVIAAATMGFLRARYSLDVLVATGVVIFAAATVALATIHQFSVVALAMLAGGVAWMTVMTTFNVSAQMAPPAWMRARALAVYILVFQGSLAAGSGIWGAIASRFGVPASLLIAAGALVAGLATGARLRLSPKVMEDQYVA